VDLVAGCSKLQSPFRQKGLRIGLIITVGVKKEASVDATYHGTFLVDLRRGILNNWNPDLRQENYEVGKLSNSIVTHLLAETKTDCYLCPGPYFAAWSIT
jgi:hypothetical protein